MFVGACLPLCYYICPSIARRIEPGTCLCRRKSQAAVSPSAHQAPPRPPECAGPAEAAVPGCMDSASPLSQQPFPPLPADLTGRQSKVFHPLLLYKNAGLWYILTIHPNTFL